MSIELKDARHELDILEKFINNPELIMSDLSAYGVSDYDFLFRNITINGRTFYASLIEYLKQVEVFNDDDIFLTPYSDGDNVTVKISSFEEFRSHKIMCIDFINHTYKIIDDCPAIDAVPVVRCKDCIYYEKGIDYPPYCNCPSGGISDYPQEDDFCSHGERGEEE